MGSTEKTLGIRASAVAFALLFLSPLNADAQAVARSFEELRFRVKVGDVVYITDEAGQEQSARILEVTNSSLAVSVDGNRRSFTETGVTRIRQRLSDPLWNGAVIGAATYIGAVAALAASLDGTKDCSAQCWAVNGVIFGGVGALIGTGIDALIKGRKTIYAAGEATVVVRPLLQPAKTGLSITVRF